MMHEIEISPDALEALMGDTAWMPFVRWVRQTDPHYNEELRRFAESGVHDEAGPIWYQLDTALQDSPPASEDVQRMAGIILAMFEPEDGLHPQMEPMGDGEGVAEEPPPV